MRGDERVSVIVPAYNAELTIDETLRSVRSQTYRNLEIIVVNDGSSDRTREIARSHALSDSRLRLIEQGNMGVASARNRGVQESTGPLIAPIDADDLWHPDKISRQFQLLRDAGDRVGLVYCWYATIDARSRVRSLNHRPTEEGEVIESMCARNLVGNGSSALMRKSAILEASGYDESLRARNAEGCEDYKLYFRIAEHHHFAVVRDHLTGYRQTKTNMSSDVLSMLRSRDLVAAEFELRNPHHRSQFHEGRNRFLKWLLIRSVRCNRYRDMATIAGIMLEQDHQFAWKTFSLVPATLFRGAFGPYVRRLAVRADPRSLNPLSRFAIGCL